MRDSIKSLVKIFANTYKIGEPVYEFGSMQVEGQEGFADLRPYFSGKEYVGCDNREGLGVDLVIDLHELQYIDFEQPPRTVLCMDTMEHVEYPREALIGIEQLMSSDGILLISSVMNFRIHGYPDDYWRFTPSGFKSLLKDFPHSFVGSAGQDLFPHTVIGIGFKSDVLPEEHITFVAEFMDWKKRYR